MENWVFWLVAGSLTFAVVGLLGLALLRRRGVEGASASQDMQVYRDQLSEVERDLARGVLNQDEAARVRVEVSRRLLEADKAAAGATGAKAAPRVVSLVGAGLMGGGLIAGAFGLYTVIGAPGYPDMPLFHRIELSDAARAARPSQAEAEAALNVSFAPAEGTDPEFLVLMEKLRAALAKNPEELQGQMLLARNETMLGNFAAAHPAQARVIALKGADVTADDYAAYGDMLILAVDGFISPEAEDALEKALQLDPRNGPARYYSGLLYAQTGRPDLTYRVWRPLLAESRPQAPWYPPIMDQIEAVARAAGIRYTPPRAAPVAGPFTAPGPSADDIEAAQDMSAEDRQEMIRSMVERLAERLGSDGGTPEEWARLIGALGVLGDTERAAVIWTEAQQVFAGDADAVETIRAAAQSAGVAE